MLQKQRPESEVGGSLASPSGVGVEQLWQLWWIWLGLKAVWGFLGGSVVKNIRLQFRKHRRCRFDPWVRKIPWRRVWQPTPVFLPGESLRERNLTGYSPQCLKESDTTEVT